MVKRIVADVKKMTQRQMIQLLKKINLGYYLNQCPNCESDSVVFTPEHYIDTNVRLDISCKDCGLMWTNWYENISNELPEYEKQPEEEGCDGEHPSRWT